MRKDNLDHLEVESPKQKGGFRRFLIYLFCSLLGLLLGGFAYVYLLLSQSSYSPVALADEQGKLQNSTNVDANGMISGIFAPENFPIKKVKHKDALVTNILIFGLDESSGENSSGPSRSDSMIIMSLDRRHKTVKLTSLMRDLQVNLPGREGMEDKLNSAYVHGGIGMLINVINEHFDLDIQNFVKFDFWSAADFIDAAGGVEIDVLPEEVEYVNGSVRQQAEIKGIDPTPNLLSAAGRLKLNGIQAVAWARIRAIGNDYARTSRQRTVMMSLLASFGQKSMTAKMNTLTNSLKSTTSNMSNAAILSLAVSNYTSIAHFMEYRVPADGLYYTNEANWNMIVDFPAQTAALHQFIYEQAPPQNGQ